MVAIKCGPARRHKVITVIEHVQRQRVPAWRKKASYSRLAVRALCGRAGCLWRRLALFRARYKSIVARSLSWAYLLAPQSGDAAAAADAVTFERNHTVSRPASLENSRQVGSAAGLFAMANARYKQQLAI